MADVSDIVVVSTRGGRIKTADLSTTFDNLPYNTEDILSPALFGKIFFIHAKFGLFVQVESKSAYLIGSVGFDLCQHSLVYGTRQYKTSVIIGMFSNQINTAGREVEIPAIEFLKFFFYCIYIHNKNV